MVSYKDIKKQLYSCLDMGVHDTVVYIKSLNGQDFNGMEAIAFKKQAKIDHQIDFPDLYQVEVEEVV